MKCLNCKREVELKYCQECFNEYLMKYFSESKNNPSIDKLQTDIWDLKDGI
jgi:hypothetical protein